MLHSENWMVAEITEQPSVIARGLEENRKTAEAISRHVRDRQIKHCIIAARGTSNHAAIYGKYLCETQLGIPVSLASPSVWTLYEARPKLENCMVIGLSQSGQGTDIIRVLEAAKQQGAFTLAITNFGESPLATVADEVLLLQAGQERSVAATKTYTASLAALALTASMVAKNATLETELREVPTQMQTVLSLEPEIKDVAERYCLMENCVAIARGFNQCTAFEAGLKLTETCYVLAHAYSGADFEHGPIAVVDQGFPCFLFNPEGKPHSQLVDLARRLGNRGADRLIVAHDEESLALGERSIRIPVFVPERVSPLVYILAGQLFAYHLSKHKGYDPDNPRGLNKVTKTI